MTKAELIERYGAEWYEAHKAKKRERYHNNAKFREEHKAKCNARSKARYNNDIEYREAHKVKCKERHKERYNNEAEYREYHKRKFKALYNKRLGYKYSYCIPGEFERIENYEHAKADNFKGWCIHHRLELTLNGEYAHTAEELKRLNMYYNRPYFELIFLRNGDHTKLHKNARHYEEQ